MESKEIERKMKELEAKEAEITRSNKERREIFWKNEEVLKKNEKTLAETKRKEKRLEAVKDVICFGVLLLVILTVFITGTAIGRNLWFLESVGF